MDSQKFKSLAFSEKLLQNPRKDWIPFNVQGGIKFWISSTFSGSTSMPSVRAINPRYFVRFTPDSHFLISTRSPAFRGLSGPLSHCFHALAYCWNRIGYRPSMLCKSNLSNQIGHRSYAVSRFLYQRRNRAKVARDMTSRARTRCYLHTKSYSTALVRRKHAWTVVRAVNSMVNACMTLRVETAHIGSARSRSPRKATGADDSCMTVHHVRNGRARKHWRMHIAVSGHSMRSLSITYMTGIDRLIGGQIVSPEKS